MDYEKAQQVEVGKFSFVAIVESTFVFVSVKERKIFLRGKNAKQINFNGLVLVLILYLVQILS